MPHVMRSEISTDDPALAQAMRRIEELCQGADGYPVSTRDGRWQFSRAGTWTAGFWPGQLWLAFLLTGDGQFATAAHAQCEGLARDHLHDETHDLGMLFYPSLVRGWQITGDPDLRRLALTAASNLATRYNPAGCFIRAIGAPNTSEQKGYVIVDTLMNLPILFWATRETGDRRFGEIAFAHAMTSLRHHVRPDGSTAQVYYFDAATGAPIGPGVHQGLSEDTCWSRGQAWAIHGFAAAYGWTGEPVLLDTARNVADWWIGRLSSGDIPRWDFDSPAGDPLDSSAAAIAVCGLLALSRVSGTRSYAHHAELTLAALTATCTSDDPAEQGLLLHGTGFKPKGRDVDVSLAYGDYFYLAALLHRTAPATFAQHYEIGSI